MQAVIAIPDQETLQRLGGPEQALMRPVCGVPLMVRIVKTAVRAGVDSLLIIWPSKVPLTIWLECKRALRSEGIYSLTLMPPESFHARNYADWASIWPALNEQFLWLPWNWVTHEGALQCLPIATALPETWSEPVLTKRSALLVASGIRAGSEKRPDGVVVTSPRTAFEAARILVAYSGASLDGIYSKFYRWLCRPLVQLMTYTRTKPNVVTIARLAAATAGACLFAHCDYAAYGVGAVLLFLSGLLDEIDGLLAHIQFRESAPGTWFKGLVDNASYLLVFAGMMIGLRGQYATGELIYGIALIAGFIVSVMVINLQRKRPTELISSNE